MHDSFKLKIKEKNYIIAEQVNISNFKGFQLKMFSHSFNLNKPTVRIYSGV